jgi:hypothetical protein
MSGLSHWNARGVLFASILGLTAASQVSFGADMPRKAPLPPALPTWLTDAVPMFGDFILIDTPINVLRGSFKIAENESPRPLDRVYLNYNFYSGVDNGFNTFDVHRATLGFEKTFLDGNASIGMRLPFIDRGGANSEAEIGDISFIAKYAFINDPGGNVLSAGLVVTAPTAQQAHGFDILRGQQIHSTVLQPFVAGKFQAGNFFLQGFSSVAFPTDSRDVTWLFNDIGVGYWAFRDDRAPVLRGVVPMIELHINTPLEQTNTIGSPFPLETVVNLTGGVQFNFAHGIQFGVAAGTPLTGPKPYDFETIARLNFRY